MSLFVYYFVFVQKNLLRNMRKIKIIAMTWKKNFSFHLLLSKSTHPVGKLRCKAWKNTSRKGRRMKAVCPRSVTVQMFNILCAARFPYFMFALYTVSMWICVTSWFDFSFDLVWFNLEDFWIPLNLLVIKKIRVKFTLYIWQFKSCKNLCI